MEPSEKADVLSGSSDSEEEIHVYHLRIHDTEPKDAGEWKIEVKDKYGTATTACNLAVVEPEPEQTKLEDQKVVSDSATKEAAEGDQSTKGGKNESDDEEILVYKLRIHDADMKDAGQWKCEVTDKYGVATTSCNLMVFDSSQPREAPRFRTSLWNETAKEGDSFKLRCLVAGNPRPQIKWFKDDVDITRNSRHAIITIRDDGTTILEIVSLLASRDTGVYRCEAHSNIGYATTEAKLTVKKDDFGYLRDQYSTLEKINKRSDYYYDEIVEAEEISLNKKVRPLKKKHIDAYYENYRNERNSLKTLYAYERNAILKMGLKWDKDHAFYFKEHLKNKCVVEGGTVILSCYVAGIPPFISRWFKDGVPLCRDEYEKYFIRSRSGYLSLEIPITDLDDTGEYEVEVRNEQGRIRSQSYLQVEPCPPAHELNIALTSQNNITSHPSCDMGYKNILLQHTMYDQKIEYQKPTFLLNVRHVHVKVGQTATFEASVTGSPTPSVHWYKDGVIIQENSRITMHHVREHHCYVLNIHDTDFDDIGLYKCEAHSWAGRAGSSAKLIVLEKGADIISCEEEEEQNRKQTKIDIKDVIKIDEFRPKKQPVDQVAVIEDMYMASDTATVFTQPPIFTTLLPPKVTVDHGESLFLTVETDGFPRPRVIWMREMKKIDPDVEGITISKDGIEIKKASHTEHSGIYTAKLTNSLKEAESSCKVLVMAYVHESDLPKSDEKKGLNDIPPSDPRIHKSEVSETPEDRTLHIPEVTPTDSQCLSSHLTKAVKESDLPISKVSPHFSQPLESEYHPLERDENVRMQCIVAGDPSPKVIWFKDGERLQESKNLKIQWDSVTGIAAILLKKLHILDTGDYECYAYSENGCYKTKTTLHIKALEQQQIKTVAHETVKEKVVPKFISDLKDKTSYSGGIIRLDCAIDGLPSPDVKWFKDGERLFPTKGKISISKLDAHHSLVIENFVKENEGQYSCEATNSSGTSISSAYLSVKADEPDAVSAEPSSPVFDTKMENVMVLQGGVAVFKCSAKGQPLPRFKWQKDMIDVTQSNNISINNNSAGESTLTIKNVCLEDTGMYVVTAKNSLGREKLSATLMIGEPDDSIKRRLSVDSKIATRSEENLENTKTSMDKSVDDVDKCSTDTGNVTQVKDDTDRNVTKEISEVDSKLEQPESVKRDHSSNVLETESFSHFMERKHQDDEVAEGIQLAESEVGEKKDVPTAMQEAKSDCEKDSKSDEKQKDHISNVLEAESLEHFMARKHKDDEVVDGIHLAEQEAQEAEKSQSSDGKESEKKENMTENMQSKESKERKRDHSSDVLETESLGHFMARKHQSDEIVDGIHLAENEAQEREVKSTDDKSISKGEGNETGVKDESSKEKERDHSTNILEAESLEHFKARKHQGDDIVDVIHSAEAEAKGAGGKTAGKEVSQSEQSKGTQQNSEEQTPKESSVSVQTEGSFDFETIPEGSSQQSDRKKDTKDQIDGTKEDIKTSEKLTSKQREDEVDLDLLVSKAEEVLGEELKKTEEISFEDVLARSVVEESVTEAATEMDKIKSKRRKFSKSKKRSDSVDSETDKEVKNFAGKDVEGASKDTSGTSNEIKTAEEELVKAASISCSETSPCLDKTSDRTDGNTPEKSLKKTSLKGISDVIFEEVKTEEGHIDESPVTSESSKAVESLSTLTTEAPTQLSEKPLQRVQHQVSQEEFASAVHDILDVKSIKLNETREAVIQQTTTCGKTQILEVSARRVSRQNSQPIGVTATDQHGHNHHVHHPPEILLPPDTQYAYEHTEIELTVKVRASRGAQVTWYHDGQKVNLKESSHYEMFEEEYPIDSSDAK